MRIHHSRPHARLRWLALGLAIVLVGPGRAQMSTDRVEGLRDNTPRLHALTGARLVIGPDRIVDNGTLVVRDGIVVAAGAGVPVPAGARVWKLGGRSVYAGFIDLASNIGVPASLRAPPPKPPLGDAGEPPRADPPKPLPLVARALGSRNPRVHPEQDLAQLLEFKPDEVKAARGLGFTSVLATPSAGVFRGQSALVNLADGLDAKAQLLAPRVALTLAHEIDDNPVASYPNSLMGAIALVRQTFHDARWYRGATEFATRNGARGERPEASASLEALAPALAGHQPVIYLANDEQDYQRIAKIRDEFGLRVLLQGNGHEYRRLRDLVRAAAPVIVPLNFPPVPEIENPDSALDSSLESLQHWEQAPSNPALLERAGVEIAVTANGLKNPAREFWPRLRQSVKRGLPPAKALAALTTVPARLIGDSRRLGTLEPGHIANIVVARGDLFADDKATVELLFVDGRPYPTEAFDRFDARGTWAANSGGRGSSWVIAGTAEKPTLTLDGASCPLSQREHQLVVRLPCGNPPTPAALAPSAAAAPVPAAAPKPPLLTIVAEGRDDTLRGSAQSADGSLVPWSATRTAAFIEPAPTTPPEALPPAPATTYPAGAFGIDPPARPAVLLVRNATLWTSAAPGRLERADLLLRDGKIAAVGTALPVPSGALVIDASGKHVTPGIVDAHSHTAIIGGTNEATSSVTAEVRIGDVLDATDISLYRELAGGVTVANVLHGSANTIGGQNQVIKLRWGLDAEALKFEGAMPGIKFALGENVKQANWGEQFTTRYPQTRMGVEQILRDAFAAARAYSAEREAWQRAPRERAEPRRDLQLDTLAELLARQRIVHVHSYRQDEILMFARLSQELGFTVGTFQHVLEGYKVADVIAKMGAGGSTFSDWWGYKMEVLDAIPTNGALMHSAGVLTSFNSDSDELARRLNTEAAKAVKYGGLDETEALKFVTINPAKQLRIDARTGSLEVGKDADFVVWSGHPLSTFSRVEQTWIDGRRYFDIATDAQLRAHAEAERARLIAKALPLRLAAAEGDGEAKPGAKPDSAGYNDYSDSDGDAKSYAALLRRVHAASARRGSYWAREAQHECTEVESR